MSIMFESSPCTVGGDDSIWAPILCLLAKIHHMYRSINHVYKFNQYYCIPPTTPISSVAYDTNKTKAKAAFFAT